MSDHGLIGLALFIEVGLILIGILLLSMFHRLEQRVIELEIALDDKGFSSRWTRSE